MTTEGIEAIFLQTHNWGRAARFFQALGYQLDFETDHNSGQLSNRMGPPVFVAEVPADRECGMRVAFRVPDAEAFEIAPELDMVSGFDDTHWGTREMVIRDPDGRLWNLQAPGHGQAGGEPHGHG